VSKENEKILKESIFSLEVEGFRIANEEKQKVADMLEGKITLESIIAEYVSKGYAYAGV